MCTKSYNFLPPTHVHAFQNPLDCEVDGFEFEQAPGVGDGQGGLACCSLWSHKESDTIEQVNWTERL